MSIPTRCTSDVCTRDEMSRKGEEEEKRREEKEESKLALGYRGLPRLPFFLLFFLFRFGLLCELYVEASYADQWSLQLARL